MSTGTGPQDSQAIYAKLLEGLEENGSLTDTERNRLMLLAMTGLYNLVLPLPAKVRKLEEQNIIAWIECHPKVTSLIITFLILSAMFFHEISPWVISHIAMLAGLQK